MDKRTQLIEAVEQTRQSCQVLASEQGSTNQEVINACASVGVGVDANNRD